MERIVKNKKRIFIKTLLLFTAMSLLMSGCTSDKVSEQEYYPGYLSAKTQDAGVKTKSPEKKTKNVAPSTKTKDTAPTAKAKKTDTKTKDIEVKTKDKNTKKTTNVEVKSQSTPSRMVSYDVVSVGRSNPFMPYNEMVEYERARSSALSEAAAKNAKIREIRKLQDYAIREADDISPYSFNLPVPPTSLATGSVAAKITKTKVVGIMYNTDSPSAIINVDDKDYLVRPGDKIIGQEYKIVKITPTWVTAAMGSNLYSAAIGELFTNDRMETNQTDIYKLEERFGGRKI